MDEARTPSQLFAPWRMEYIRGLDRPAGTDCFLCAADAAGNDPQRCQEALVIWGTTHSVVLLNRFPYTNGHLLVAPRRHLADLAEMTADEMLDIQTQTATAVALLKRAVAAQGFNIGMNLGRCAGAGLPGHLHQHIVPRWNGDTNFMHVVGETRIIPQALSQIREELVRLRGQGG
jgi:ATP adenylyltransferase